MTIDEFTKLASMVGGIIAAFAAVAAYYDTATREQKKPFRETQLNLCREASDAAATLASFAPRAASNLTPTDKLEDPWQLARGHFEQLYWGSLAIVENNDVEARMVGFRNDLVGVEDKLQAGSLPTADRRRLQRAALGVSHA